MKRIRKIVSGGQTGVDRASLDAAMAQGIPHGGWVPRGRKAEDGRIPERYDLREMSTAQYARRTEQNVLDSDATLIVSRGPLTGGSRLTRELANRHRKPCLHVDLALTEVDETASRVRSWLEEIGAEILNVAGPRASNDPGIYDLAVALLERVLQGDEERTDA